mmetsp:Transcript_71459/g.140319  ORF Transcript_71459/g.140319 Transcript_71459/m.140319 type:complete len:450 (+) Transcript_71459:56-1405(+)
MNVRGDDDAQLEDDDGDFIWGRESAPHLDYSLPPDLVGTRAQQFLRMHQNLHGVEPRESSEANGLPPLSLGSADGVHTTVWEAAIALHLLVLREERRSPGRWRGVRVLELGAGTGLVGLTFAACGAEVVLTELPTALPLLQHNISANLAALHHLPPPVPPLSPSHADAAAGVALAAGVVQSSSSPPPTLPSSFMPPVVCALEWGLPLQGRLRDFRVHGTTSFAVGKKPAGSSATTSTADDAGVTGGGDCVDRAERSAEGRRPFDLVVGADVVYSEDLAKPLLDAIDKVCTPGVTELWLCRLRRGAATGAAKAKAFYSALDGSSNMPLLPAGEGDAGAAMPGAADALGGKDDNVGLGFSAVQTLLVGGPRRPPLVDDAIVATSGANAAKDSMVSVSSVKADSTIQPASPPPTTKTEPRDPALSKAFYKLSDQSLPFEVVRAFRQKKSAGH